MKKLLLIGLLLYSATLFAQTDTAYAYVDSNYRAVKDWNIAAYYYKAYMKDSTSYILSMHNRTGQLQKKEIYLDAALQIKNGQSVTYKNGKPILKGVYINNEREGVFVSYDTLGNVLETQTYKRDTLDGAYAAYWPNGIVKQVGSYTHGNKIGEWTGHYESGKVAMSEKYNGSDPKPYSSTYLDEEGKETTFVKLETPPTFPGGIDKFYMLLARNIKYPPDAAEKNIQGNVFISFTVTETGAIENIKIDRKLYPSLDQEALRVMKLSPKWIPGKHYGKNVRVLYNIPIRFSIQN